MSTSPTRYYASRSSSRSGSRPTSPQDASAVRSQAVAKLKRAASLPRKSDGRRPSAREGDAGGSSSRPSVEPLEEYQPGPSQPLADTNPYDDQEILSPSPVNQHFDHAHMYDNTPGLQRSGSSSSSYQLPTPPQMTFGQVGNMAYYGSTPTSSHTPDWAAMQLAHSYLPSISPIAFPPSPYLHPGQPEPAPGRHTPSPLPTLGALRNLQRSNSAAARAQAMSKLTGGRETPSDESRAPTPLVQAAAPPLHRAGTHLGASTLVEALGRKHEEVQPQPAREEPAISHAEPRPRLQRSFTVSSSNMGEERRSAVGRRMVERLGERRAARQKEEDEVRRLWEERRAAAEASESPIDDGSDGDDVALGETEDEEDMTETMPVFQRTSPVEPPSDRLAIPETHGFLQAPNRPVSRGTIRSTDEPFQYESHLRRSLSARTARGAVAAVEAQQRQNQAQQHSPRISGDESHAYDDHEVPQNLAPPEDMLVPRIPFITPTKHFHSSTSTLATPGDSSSPGESILSRDALGSMMFIMGRGSATGPAGSSRTSDVNWPSEVEDNSGSDWGTPGRELSLPDHSSQGQSPLINNHTSAPPLLPPKDLPRSESANASARTSEMNLSPPFASLRNSVMSWEEVGGPEDRSVPSDAFYHKKSGSVSAKIGRKIGTAMRKRSQSRSSAGSSLTGEPLSPGSLSIAIQNFGRRGSESSLTPSSASALRTMLRGSPNTLNADHMRHQPSISSLSPSLPSQTDSAHTSILQHQLADNPSQVSFIPRADINDPRIHHSKMSPFPGILNLERMSADPTPDASPRVTPLPRSDSNSSSLGPPAKNSHHGRTESILSVAPSGEGSRRASDESTGKKSWLAKAFGHQSSGSLSRSSSINREISKPEDSPSLDSRPMGNQNPVVQFTSDSDPFAAPPPPLRPPHFHHRSASPSVSVVPELSEEGSRLTRFTVGVNRGGTNTPNIEELEEKMPSNNAEAAPSKLVRLNQLLALSSDDPTRPEILDDPPRKLLLAHQVLQVVNAHNVKDRFLFLFNDILVIAKPILSHNLAASLDMDFIVKSILPLDTIRLSGFSVDEDDVSLHAMDQFIALFAKDPFAAVRTLVTASHGRITTAFIANILFSHSEVDRTQLGIYLASDERILRAFLDRCQLSGFRVDVALRRFLPSIRMPDDTAATESILRTFAKYHFELNQNTLPYSSELAMDLVVAVMQLHAVTLELPGFGAGHDIIPLDEFVADFKAKDPHRLVPPTILEEIYFAASRNPLCQAMTQQEQSQLGVRCSISPALPSRLCFNIWSDSIVVAIPSIDPTFRISLLGSGLESDPPVLSFTKSNRASFKLRGRALGSTGLIFDRLGPNANLYTGLPTGSSLTVERAFMKHTFKVEIPAAATSKRVYCFSMAHTDTYGRWANHLPTQVELARQVADRVPVTIRERLRAAANKMATAVLQDALVPSGSSTTAQSPSGISLSQQEKGAKLPRPIPLRRTRSGSVSVAYPAQHREEVLLANHLPPSNTFPDGTEDATNKTNGRSADEIVQTGKEIVLLCRQNSLLPSIIELLEPGFGGVGGVSKPARPVMVSRSGRSTPLQRNDSRSNTPLPFAAGLGGLQRRESERHRAVGGLV